MVSAMMNLLLAVLLTCVALFHVAVSEPPGNVSFLNSDVAIGKLIDFFSNTYIEEVQGNKKDFHCYSSGWNLHHFHHACIRGNMFILVYSSRYKLLITFSPSKRVTMESSRGLRI